jgi:ABC-type multidrug transport system ATPase subunit
MDALVVVEHLHKKFGDLTAVDDLSFTVNERDIYGFLGQNGAGKSTTIRMMLTLVKPDNGSIKIFGKELFHSHNEILSRTGAIIERPDLYKYLSAYDNLAIFAKLSGKKFSKKLLLEQLDKVGLADRWNSKVKTFSQGMKQRMGIAVALVHDPELIILDEPTNGLDPQGIADMRKLIIDLSRVHGKTVIISSHLLSEVELMATRMLVIHKGKKIVEGEVNELLHPSGTIVKIKTVDDGRTREILVNSTWSSMLQPDKNSLSFKINKDEVPVLTAWLIRKDVQVLSVQPRHSLEDYFLSLTNSDTHVETV